MRKSSRHWFSHGAYGCLVSACLVLALLIILTPMLWADHIALRANSAFEPGTSGIIRVQLVSHGSRQGAHIDFSYDPLVMQIDSIVVDQSVNSLFNAHFNAVNPGRISMLFFDESAERNHIVTNSSQIAAIYVSVLPTAMYGDTTMVYIPAALIADSALTAVDDLTADELWIKIGTGVGTALAQLEAGQTKDGSVLITWSLDKSLQSVTTDIYRYILPDGQREKVTVEALAGAGPHEFEDSSDIVKQGGEFKYEVVLNDSIQQSILGEITVVTTNHLIPAELALRQNYPNPFNPTTTILFDVPRPTQVSIKIYDAAGRLVRTLWDKVTAAGFHSVAWKGDNNQNQQVASGVYFYRLHADSRTITKKMVILR